MSSLARKLQEQQNQQRQHVAEPERRRASRQKVTAGERVIWTIFAAFLCFGGVQIISAQADIYKTNKEIQEMKSAIGEQQKVNGDLQALVEEMSTYEAIMAKAREKGLELNPNQIKGAH